MSKITKILFPNGKPLYPEDEDLPQIKAKLLAALESCKPEKYKGTWFSEDPQIQKMLEDAWSDATQLYHSNIRKLFE